MAGLDADMLVAQHRDAQPAHELRPRVDAGEVVVIAGDEEHSVLGPQSRQRSHVRPDVAYRSVDEIAGDGDEVRIQRIGAADQLCGKAVIE